MRSIEWLPEDLETFDAALICTDHDCVDYEALVQGCPLVVATRNATKDIEVGRQHIVKA